MKPTTGDGLTVIENVWAVPKHDKPALRYSGVTTMDPTKGLLLLFCPVNAEIAPTPLAPNPILGVVFVQLYNVP